MWISRVLSVQKGFLCEGGRTAARFLAAMPNYIEFKRLLTNYCAGRRASAYERKRECRSWRIQPAIGEGVFFQMGLSFKELEKLDRARACTMQGRGIEQIEKQHISPLNVRKLCA
jgi:hypothetical protein